MFTLICFQHYFSIAGPYTLSGHLVVVKPVFGGEIPVTFPISSPTTESPLTPDFSKAFSSIAHCKLYLLCKPLRWFRCGENHTGSPACEIVWHQQPHPPRSTHCSLLPPTFGCSPCCRVYVSHCIGLRPCDGLIR